MTSSRRNFLKCLSVSCVAVAWDSVTPGLLKAASISEPARPPFKKFVVGHRGACAYAPENTLASYKLALEQGVDYVEQDLQLTKDGVLVCGHDVTLERVTNVAEVFPERFKLETVRGKEVKKWYIHDFTLKEIKQLDAGSKFEAKFKGETIPTWQEAIELIKGKAGVCPETKAPDYYGKLGFNMEQLVLDALKKNGLEKPEQDGKTPVLIQSFSPISLKKLYYDLGVKHPLMQLSSIGTQWTNEQLTAAAAYSGTISPEKSDVSAEMVKRAHAMKMQVIPYTFSSTNVKGYKDVKEEMGYYLHTLGVDGMFTNNPDQFPRG